MYIIVLIVIIILAFIIDLINKCVNKPFKKNGKCVSKCDNFIAEDGITCVDSCPNFTEEETKTCVAKCPSYKPYSQADKYCSPYNILDAKTNTFNLNKYSYDNYTVLSNELSCSKDTKVIAINRLYNNEGNIAQDYFISKNFGETFERYPINNENELISTVKVSPKGDCIIAVSNVNIKVYHENNIYTHALEKEDASFLRSESFADYDIIDEQTHFYLYNVTIINKNIQENQNITYKHGIKISTDYGKTFSVLYETTVSDIDLLNARLCVSKDRKEVFYTVENTVTNNSTIFTSSDYGKTFTSFDVKGKVSSSEINDTGSCKVVTSYTLLDNKPNKGYIYKSTDYGKTWAEIIVNENFSYIKVLSITERGQNQLFLFEQGENKNGILISKDYGNTYSILFQDAQKLVRGCAMSSDSKYITICTDTNIKTSSNYGDTFTDNNTQYSNLGSSTISSQVYVSSSPYNYLNGKINIILSSSNSLFYTTLLSFS